MHGTTMKIIYRNITVLSDAIFNPIDIYQYFRGNQYVHLLLSSRCRYFWNVSKFMLDYMMMHPTDYSFQSHHQRNFTYLQHLNS